MNNTNFQQHLIRLHELGEIGIAMDEAKDFLEMYGAKKGRNDVRFMNSSNRRK